MPRARRAGEPRRPARPARASRAALARLLDDVRACRRCEAELPLGPRPVLRATPTSRVLVVGQAPGTRVHETGVPWNDPSGDRLREWLGLDRDTFYDERRIAIIPMGLCYPGRYERGGDLPPRPECAELWFDALRAQLPRVELTLLIGSYAQRHYLGDDVRKTLTETVAAWRDYLPDFVPTPHPSWRTTRWLKEHPFFGDEVLPELRRRVTDLIGDDPAPGARPV